MKSSAQVVVIGGGVVGASVLFHLTELGWTDVVLVERKELTAGSTWHAAGGMHTLNGDPNVAKLQQYTVGLYREIEQRSGRNCGIHMSGGLRPSSCSRSWRSSTSSARSSTRPRVTSTLPGSPGPTPPARGRPAPRSTSTPG
jgi:glycine/D-amino acid oxidase-like deaminating enzyme